MVCSIRLHSRLHARGQSELKWPATSTEGSDQHRAGPLSLLDELRHAGRAPYDAADARLHARRAGARCRSRWATSCAAGSVDQYGATSCPVGGRHRYTEDTIGPEILSTSRGYSPLRKPCATCWAASRYWRREGGLCRMPELERWVLHRLASSRPVPAGGGGFRLPQDRDRAVTISCTSISRPSIRHPPRIDLLRIAAGGAPARRAHGDGELFSF